MNVKSLTDAINASIQTNDPHGRVHTLGILWEDDDTGAAQDIASLGISFGRLFSASRTQFEIKSNTKRPKNDLIHLFCR